MDTVHTVVRDHLSMSKLCDRWVPRMSTQEMKNTRAMISTTLLTNYNTDPEIFHLHMGIGDDAWVHYHKPESKFESMERQHADFVQEHTQHNETYGSCILGQWRNDECGLLGYSTAMSGQLYADLLLMLQESIKDERQGKLRHRVFRRQENTPVHTNQFAMHTVYDHGFKLL